MWETRSPNHTLLVLFLYQHLDINKNIKKKKSHRHLHIEKEGKPQGEIHQINKLPESFQSEVIEFLLSQQGLIFLASGMLQLWGKPLCKAGKSPAGSPNLANQKPCSNKNVCSSLRVSPCIHWDSNVAERDTWTQSKALKIITR